MKKNLIITIYALFGLLTGSVWAGPLGTAFTYQGRLSDGTNPAQGIYDLRFTIYDALAGGTMLGGPLTNSPVGVTNGYFAVTLDFGAAFNGNARWLEIGVRTNGGGAFATLAPRQPLTPAPYALYAPSAGAAATATTAASANSVAAANVTGTLALGQLPGTVVTNNATGLTLGGSFIGNGAGLTNLDATKLTGTVADVRLSSNVALLNANQTFTGTNVFSAGKVGIGTPNPLRSLQVGDASVLGSQGMIRLASRSTNSAENRVWDVGVPQTGSDVSGAGYCFVIDDTQLSTGPEFLIHWGTGYVGIGRTNPATALDVNGTVTATGFAGNGAGLTSLNASQLAAGTVPLGQMPSAVVTNNQGGVTLAGTFAGNGNGLTNIPFSSLPAVLLTNNQSGVTLKGLTTVSNLSVTATNFVNYLVVTNPPAFNGSSITNLNASQLSAGIVPLPQLPTALVTNNESGVSLTGTFVGNGAGVSNVNLVAANSQGAITWTTNWGNFTNVSSLTVGSAPEQVITADINGDGKLDLVVPNFMSDSISVLTNTGSGGFALLANYLVGTGTEPYAVVALDVNGDGRMDLISANYGTGNLTILTNNGGGSFVFSSSPTVGTQPKSLVAADVNGDGKPDLICANQGSGSLLILTNNGSGGFVSSSTNTGFSEPQSVVAVDLNGDGKVDLAVANNTANNVVILTNNGSGRFVAASTNSVGTGPHSVTAADINGDGYVDLLVANYFDNALTLLTNNGSGGFATAATLAVGASSPSYAAAVDVNGDGRLDLISANQNNCLSVLINLGNGRFAPPVIVPGGDWPVWVTPMDINGDGRMDLVSADYWGPSVSLYLNTPSFAANFYGSYAGDGSSLTNLDATDLTGTVADARLSANVALLNANQAFTGANRFAGVVTLTNAGNHLSGTGTFSGNGGGLTNLDATDLTGTVADARLSANVALLNANQAFTGSNRFAGVVTLTNAANTVAGNGAGLTNIICSANYVSSYSTTTQAVVTAGMFQDITNNTDAQISGWTHAANTASFTCGQKGLYLIQYNAAATTTATASSSVSVRAAVNGTEIAGSQATANANTASLVVSLSRSFIASFSSGGILKFQLTGSSTNDRLISDTGTGTTRPSFSCTIMRLQ